MTKIRFKLISGFTKSLTGSEGERERTSECLIHTYNLENTSLLKIVVMIILIIIGKENQFGPVRESNPGPLAPKARIMPLDQQAKRITICLDNFFNLLLP